VELVDPEYTSGGCSNCGFTSQHNRENEVFECLKYGHENHADYNAVARNLRFLAARQT
jgi:transposase